MSILRLIAEKLPFIPRSAAIAALMSICFSGGLARAQGSPILYASPSPIVVPQGQTLGATTIYVNAPNLAGDSLSLWVNAPPNATPNPGALFARCCSSFQASTGMWVTSGMSFFLWDDTTNMLVDALTVGLTSQTLTPSSDGCAWGPYTTCIDAVPSTNISTTWIEDSNGTLLSEWTVTGNGAQPGGAAAVTGTAVVFPAVSGCPNVTYQVTGSYSPTAVTNGTTAAYTGISWTAANPNPNTPCGGFQPNAWVKFNGTITNAVNDVAHGTWSNNFGLNGNFSAFADPDNFPQGEETEPDSFGVGNQSTQLTFVQKLEDTPDEDEFDPDDTLFQGRQVFESIASGTSATDACWQASNGAAPFGSFAVEGSVWNVGANNLDGTNAYEDAVGWTLTDVQWYKQFLPANSLPCSAQFQQSMNILHSNFANPLGGEVDFQNYASHAIMITINPTTVTVSKDGMSMSNPY